MFKRSLIVVAIVGILGIITTVILFNNGQTKTGEGIISGTVTIGPVYPVCRVNTTATAPPSPWSSIQVVLQPGSGNAIHIPVKWTLSQGCEVSGAFQVVLAAGTYKLDLSSCASEPTRFFGCTSLPKIVVVSANTTTSIDISIDTGIR